MAKFGDAMSLIGQQPVKIPQGVTVKINRDEVVVTGPKGSLKRKLRPEVKVSLDEKNGELKVKRQVESKLAKSLHGLTRSLMANMVQGVHQGFEKKLELVGTGYRVKMEADKIILSVGFSHPVEFKTPAGIKLDIEGNNFIKVSGCDKALVGQVAASIRAIRPPEPYKGKGIRYQGEVVKTKPGKAGKVGAGGWGEGGEG